MRPVCHPCSVAWVWGLGGFFAIAEQHIPDVGEAVDDGSLSLEQLVFRCLGVSFALGRAGGINTTNIERTKRRRRPSALPAGHVIGIQSVRGGCHDYGGLLR